jgi:hypothetical protein
MEVYLSNLQLNSGKIALGILGAMIAEIAIKEKKSSEKVAEELITNFLIVYLDNPIVIDTNIGVIGEKFDDIAESFLEGYKVANRKEDNN